MKSCDILTQIYKKIQQKDLSVYIETDNNAYNVMTKDHHTLIHTFDSKEKAVNFCRSLDLNILAYVKNKPLPAGNIFE
jgi:hypothetical protein